MPIARCNGIDICYETLGAPTGRPLVLIMGLRHQLIRWPQGLLDRLVDRGHRVVIFDNRDVGCSTVLSGVRVPDFGALVAARAAGKTTDAPYTLSDMARDTVGLLDELDITAAHLMGVSLGGMIAQTVAIEHPERVASLTSVMSTTGRPGLPGPSERGAQVLGTRAPVECGAFIEHSLEVDRFLTGPHMPCDEEASRRHAERAFERGIHPDGSTRQVAAVLASGSRHELLPSLRMPALVVHGDADELIDAACGRDTAQCIPGARYVEIPGMGHSLPAPIWDRLADEVAALTSA